MKYNLHSVDSRESELLLKIDQSQQQMTNRVEVYVEGEWKEDRYISHFTLRSLNPANLAKFYREVYELQEWKSPTMTPTTI